MRKIIHIDMDAFYASIEQRDNPAYKGKPVAVGHGEDRGVVAAASYEARKFGIHSAMPSKTARKKCPSLIFVETRMDIYKKVSAQIKNIFLEYTDLVETLSLDEAYLDVTVNKKNIQSATEIAKEIKEKIKKVTGLTASAGVSINKFLAKVASDLDKPDGLFIITDKKAQKFAEELAIEKFWGVGKVTTEKMHRLGILKGKDLKKYTQEELIRIFGKAGETYYANARGIDERDVVSDREHKSIGAETTFRTDINAKDELLENLRIVAADAWKRIEKNAFKGCTVTIKVKYSDFRQITRSRTFPGDIENFKAFLSAGEKLLTDLISSEEFKGRKVRLIGMTLANNRKQKESLQMHLSFYKK